MVEKVSSNLTLVSTIFKSTSLVAIFKIAGSTNSNLKEGEHKLENVAHSKWRTSKLGYYTFRKSAH